MVSPVEVVRTLSACGRHLNEGVVLAVARRRRHVVDVQCHRARKNAGQIVQRGRCVVVGCSFVRAPEDVRFVGAEGEARGLLLVCLHTAWEHLDVHDAIHVTCGDLGEQHAAVSTTKSKISIRAFRNVCTCSTWEHVEPRGPDGVVDDETFTSIEQSRAGIMVSAVIVNVPPPPLASSEPMVNHESYSAAGNVAENNGVHLSCA